MASKSKRDNQGITESEIIKLVREKNAQPDPRVIVGLGDDAAVVNLSGLIDTARRLNLANQVITTDLLVEGIHFDRRYMSLADIGYKSLAVNLSDIAAMGGVPTFAFGTLGVPGGTTRAEILDVLDGVEQSAGGCGAKLIGGDTVAAPQWIIGFTVIGDLEHRALTRNGAKPGDTIWHSGQLGLSQIGLHMLWGGAGAKNHRAKQVHARPQPQIELGLFLAQSQLATACLDLSDSLSQCLLQLAEASDVGLTLDFCGYHFDQLVTKFVASRRRSRKAGCTKFSVPAGMQPSGKGQTFNCLAELLLSCAEDYQLLFTASPEHSLRLINDSPAPLTKLGTVVDASEGCHIRDELGRSHELASSGFQHLS